jgi:hypothetical protein
MECTATVTIGGFLFEGVTVEMQTADGKNWHFAGYGGTVGLPNVAHGSGFSGDFPGLDHIDGSCFFELASAEVGGGGAVLNFHDTHGEIGNLEGVLYGGGWTACVGGGHWDAAEDEGRVAKENNKLQP